MIGNDDIICRFCLKVPRNEFILVDEITKQGIDVLSVKLNFDVSHDPLICGDCVENFRRSLSFLLTCLKSEKSILLLDTSEDKMNIDFKEFYAYKSKEIAYVDSNICRFCIKKIEGDNIIPLNDLMKENTYLSMFEKYMFNMNLTIVEDPQICFDCRDSLESYIKFIQSCRDTEEKINTYRESGETEKEEKVKLSNVFQTFLKSTSEYPDSRMRVCEAIKLERSVEEMTEIELIHSYNRIGVKEEFAIKGERMDDDLLHDNIDMSNHMSCTCNAKDSICIGCLTEPKGVRQVTQDIKIDNVSSEMIEPLEIKSEVLDIKDDITLSERTHQQRNVYKFNHEKTIYKCETCDYKTIHKYNLKNHLVTHKTEAEVTMYKCTACDFKTKHKYNLKSHSLTHNPETKLTMYNCTICDYKTTRKNTLRYHLFVHKAKAALTTYKCTICDYKTKYKRNLKNHSLAHKTKAELTLHKCTVCDYEAKRKGDLKIHLLTHKTEAESRMYKCPVCNFKTKLKSTLRSHSFVHKTEAEVKMYECAACDFKTKYNGCLKRHSLIHKTEAELSMYECTVCDYKGKRKADLKGHLLTHKTEAEVEIYKCTVCNFETKHKSSLRCHSSVHKTEAEVKMHECTACDFKTKYSGCLKRHLLVHKTKAKVVHK